MGIPGMRGGDHVGFTVPDMAHVARYSKASPRTYIPAMTPTASAAAAKWRMRAARAA